MKINKVVVGEVRMENRRNYIKIAKRLNNNKRGYLVVNANQGKHLPVSPVKAIDTFSKLAQILKKEYPNERLLLIGFAETATAIGSYVAIEMNSLYIQTTREEMPGLEYLFFSEEHSHATEQKLIKNDIDNVINKIDRIIFIEDEVTTGKTIRNIIDVMKNKYGNNIMFSVASIINGMNDENIRIYKQLGINLHYLVKTDNAKFEENIKNIKDDGKCVRLNGHQIDYRELVYYSEINARRLVKAKEYADACRNLWEICKDALCKDGINNVLVVGTEEFMYPALFIGKQLENNGKIVKSHSTTRSPIVASIESDYPIFARYELPSVYDDSRQTYLYNVSNYDLVCIITDASKKYNNGINTLVDLFSEYTKNIVVIRWQGKNEKFV